MDNKIIIITEEFDPSSDEVINWLIFYKKAFKRINSDILFDPLNSDITEFISNNNGINIKLDSIWFRRPVRRIKNIKIDEQNLLDVEDPKYISYYLNNSLRTESENINDYLLAGKNFQYVLGNYQNTKINKFHVLEKATSLGIKIPETLVTNKKRELKKFFIKNKGNIIVKLHEILLFSIKNSTTDFFVTYTEKVTKKMIDRLDNTFFVSTFQELIEKEYEIRVFYFGHQLYSMAMFTQTDNQTKLDFRRYNRTRMSRSVPYKLPKAYSKKICALMDSLNLNTGSLDIIKSKKGEFIFLEVNPVGQFGMVTDPCNYNLYKKIAESFL